MMRKFFIIDFSASKRSTHHWKSIQDFYHLLSENEKIEIFVPKYADQELYKDFVGIHRILSSPDYGPRPREYRFIRMLNLFLESVLVRNMFPISLRAKDKLKKISLFFFTRKMFRILVSNSRKHEKIVVLIPTLEPLSLFLMERTLRKKANIEWMVRVIDAQERGVLSQKNETNRLLKISKEHVKSIRLGYETFPYMRHLIELGFNEKLLYWSPFPPTKKKLNKSSSEFRIGFLGSAKSRKGFDSIPAILKEIDTQFPAVRAYVQEAQYPWHGYEVTLHELRSFSEKMSLHFLAGELTDSELEKYISMCSVVILPYDANSYSKAASAILYHAADYEIPVLATKGTGFGFEISQFGIGYEFSGIKEINIYLAKILQKQIARDNFIHYNQQRRSHNLIFLGNKPEGIVG